MNVKLFSSYNQQTTRSFHIYNIKSESFNVRKRCKCNTECMVLFFFLYFFWFWFCFCFCNGACTVNSPSGEVEVPHSVGDEDKLGRSCYSSSN